MPGEESVQAKIVEYLEKGLHFFGMGQNQEALVYWRKVLELDPNNPRAQEYIQYIEETTGMSVAGPDEGQSGVFVTTSDDDLRSFAGSAADFLFPPDEAPPQEGTDHHAAPVAGIGVAVAPPPGDESLAADAAGFGGWTDQVPSTAGHQDPGPQQVPDDPSWDQSPAEVEEDPLAWNPPSADNLSAAAEAPAWEPSPPSGADFGTTGEPVAAEPDYAPEPLQPPPLQPAEEARRAPAPEGPMPGDGYQIAAEIREEVDALLTGANELMELGDFSGATELTEKVLELDPKVPAALRLQARCRGTLLQMHRSKVGPLNVAPFVALSEEEIVWLNLDHRTGFLLSQVDGRTTYEDLLAISGMDELETFRTLAHLISERIIGNA